MHRPPEVVVAVQAALPNAQLAFRLAAKGRLDFALPLSVWMDHQYSVPAQERPKPIAARGHERWYTFMQVVRRAVNPRSKRRVTVLSGGSMSGMSGRRR